MIFLLVQGCAPDPVAPTAVTVTVDPEVGTLLHVSWSQGAEAESWVAYTVDGEARTTPATTRGAGLQEAVLLGVPSDTEVTLQVVAGAASEVVSVWTDPLPEALVPPELVTSETGTSPEAWVLGSVDVDGGEPYTGPFWLTIVDRKGRIVWYRDLVYGMSMFPRAARDGTHLAYDNYSLIDGDRVAAVVVRTSLDGTHTEEVATPRLGWSWDEMDDRTLLYDRIEAGVGVTLAQVSPDGATSTLWDCTAWLAAYDPDPEHCFTNVVNWNAERGSILWSTYWGDWVAEVDLAAGAVRWHAGAIEGGWDIEGDTFDLQHYPNFTPEGTLIVSTHIPEREGEQRAREFVLDEPEGALREVWSYGEGVKGWARYSGEAVRLENGNTLLNYGTGGEVREVDSAGSTVWSLQWGDGRTLGHTQLLDDLYALNRGP